MVWAEYATAPSVWRPAPNTSATMTSHVLMVWRKGTSATKTFWTTPRTSLIVRSMKMYMVWAKNTSRPIVCLPAIGTRWFDRVQCKSGAMLQVAQILLFYVWNIVNFNFVLLDNRFNNRFWQFFPKFRVDFNAPFFKINDFFAVFCFRLLLSY